MLTPQDRALLDAYSAGCRATGATPNPHDDGSAEHHAFEAGRLDALRAQAAAAFLDALASRA